MNADEYRIAKKAFFLGTIIGFTSCGLGMLFERLVWKMLS